MRRPRRAPLAGRTGLAPVAIWTATLGLALLAPAPATADAGTASQPASQTVAAEGERRFLDRDFTGALAAYAQAWQGAPGDPTLAYNAGTAAHRAGRLPEAVLWYLRAESADGADPWLADNLALARRALGTQGAAAPLGGELWRRSGRWLALAGILLAWSVPVLLAAGRPRRAAVTTVTVTAVALFAAGLALGSRAPRPGVLLEECRGAAGRLPAGSEVWVRRAGWDGGTWRVLGAAGGDCPARAVAPVEDGSAF